MKLHGGKIHVYSDGEGSGSTFSLDIPLSRTEALRRKEFRHLLRSILTGNDMIFPTMEEGLLEFPVQPTTDQPTMDVNASESQPKTPKNAVTVMNNALPETIPSGSTSKGNDLPRRVRVIVIDDSDVNRKLLRRLVRNYCTLCDEAVDGVDGVEKVLRAMDEEASEGVEGLICNGYDLVLTDYLMPRMDGLELVKKLRGCGYGGKIVGLTGNTEASMLQAFHTAGVDKMLTKPIQANELRDLFQSKLSFLVM